MDINARIEALERKIVALRRLQSELEKELEEVKKLSVNPAPPVRRNLKAIRMQGVEDFYTKRKITKAKK